MRMKDKLFINVKAVKPADKPFKAFKKRFHTIMGDKLDMTDEQLRTVYDGVSPYIETSIYAEMEDVLVAIRNAYQAVVGWTTEEITSEEDQDQSNKRPNVRTLGEPNEHEVIQSYMNQEKSFNRFVTHVITNYQSLPKQRIERLMVNFEGYQNFERRLFDEPFIQQYGFRKAYNLHTKLIKAFYTTFDNLLGTGKALKSDQEMKEQVLAPVLEQFEAKMDAQEGELHEQSEPL
ncbi:hypothetical protein ACUL41_17860 [Virgibacillus natechei]